MNQKFFFVQLQVKAYTSRHDKKVANYRHDIALCTTVNSTEFLSFLILNSKLNSDERFVDL